MAEEDEAVEAEEKEVIEAEETVEGGDAGPDPEVESRARAMGWAPKDDFKGNPKYWVDAEEYVRRGEEVMPILKANLRQFERDNTELKQTLKDLTDHLQRADARAYQRVLKDIKDRQRVAAEAGDVAAFDHLEQQAQAVLKEAAQGRVQPRQSSDPGVDPVAQEWAQDNKWFRSDEEMAAWATTHHELLLRTKPGLSMQENLEEVTKAVKKAFPEKFSNPRRNGTQAVEGNSAPRGRGGAKSYESLPADAKAACDRLVKQGVLKRDEYVKDYFSE